MAEYADWALLKFIKGHEDTMVKLHTSVHACVETIAELIKMINPKKIIPMHTELQRDVRDLMDAGLISVKYSKSEQAYIHRGEPSGEITVKENISKRKMMHLKRLQRLAGCMRLVDNPNPVTSHFEMFPDSSERMRQRDFETLRHIGFEAGYDRAYSEYIVNNNEVGAYDGYGVFIRDGKMVRYL